ncbi:MAG: peptidoglycan-binding protein, partial [Patescibacteria group bacterium]|nr:peptidoglycan-binding protein [Patescibacteria group bacterium]
SSSGSSIYNRYYLSYAARTGNKCPFITTYMKRGWANSPAEVTKLQNFLKDYEKMTITVNGIYDLATENAVKQFQAKYLDTVMGPWGANQPSGVVYITTTRKINELACNIPMYLTVKEALEIQAYRNRPVVTASAQPTVPSSTTASPTIENTSDTNVAPTVDNSASSTPVGPSPIIGTDDSTDNTNTAAVTKANILQRFWNFLKSIF